MQFVLTHMIIPVIVPAREDKTLKRIPSVLGRRRFFGAWAHSTSVVQRVTYGRGSSIFDQSGTKTLRLDFNSGRLRAGSTRLSVRADLEDEGYSQEAYPGRLRSATASHRLDGVAWKLHPL